MSGSQVDPNVQGLSCVLSKRSGRGGLGGSDASVAGTVDKAATPGHQGRSKSGLIDGLWRGAKDPTETIHAVRKARITCVAGCKTRFKYTN